MRTKVLLLAALGAVFLAQPVLAEPKQRRAETSETTLEGRVIYPAELRG